MASPDWDEKSLRVELMRHAWVLTRHRDDAEDLAMEVVRDALQEAREADCPRAYLHGMLRRKAADRHRRASTAKRLMRRLTPRLPLPRQTVEVAEVLAQMPTDQAEALVLKHVCGLTLEEVGRALERSPEAASSLLQRARASFRALGSHLDPGDPQ